MLRAALVAREGSPRRLGVPGEARLAPARAPSLCTKSPTRPPWSGAGVGAGSSAPSTHDLKRSVFLGNLPFNVQEETLRQQLSCCGEIENVRLVRDAATQHGKGFGYILFKEAGAVEVAIGLHEKISLPGPDKKPRAVRVFRCTTTPPQPPHNRHRRRAVARAQRHP